MKQFTGLYKKPVFYVLLNLILCLAAFAQSENAAADGNERHDLRAVMYFVSGSDNNVAGADLPKELADVSKEIKSNWGHRSLVLAGRQVIKAEAPGVFKSKIPIEIGNETSAKMPLSFLEWSITLRRADRDKAYFGNTSFSLRTPVRITRAETEAVNYEAFVITMTGFSLKKGVPTLIGSISLPTTGGTSFVIIKIEDVKAG